MKVSHYDYFVATVADEAVAADADVADEDEWGLDFAAVVMVVAKRKVLEGTYQVYVNSKTV